MKEHLFGSGKYAFTIHLSTDISMKHIYAHFLGLACTLFVLTVIGPQTYAQVSYAPDLSLRNTIRAQVWQELKPITPAKKRFLMGLIMQGNEYFNSYEDVIEERGYPIYDLASVRTFFEIVCKEVESGTEFSDDEADAYYGQVKRTFADTRQDADLSNTALQKKYDPLILKSFWVAQLFESEKKDKGSIQELAARLLAENPIDQPSIAAEREETIPAKPDIRPYEPVASNPNHATSQSMGIENIILRTVTGYGLGGVYVKNEVNVLFSNGEVFTNPAEPLEKMNIGQSKREKPEKWNTWQQRGTVIYVYKQKTGKTYEWKKWFQLRAGTNDFRLQGKFTAADGFGGAAVVNVNTVYFDRQGRFAWKTVKGGDTAWKPVFAKTNSAGTYRIDKHTLYLTYHNGLTESFFFGLYPKDNEHFVIGSSHFVPVK